MCRPHEPLPRRSWWTQRCEVLRLAGVGRTSRAERYEPIGTDGSHDGESLLPSDLHTRPTRGQADGGRVFTDDDEATQWARSHAQR